VGVNRKDSKISIDARPISDIMISSSERENEMVGTIFADFAGSREECRAFAAEHGFKAPQNTPRRESLEANGCECLSFPFKNEEQFVMGIELFAKHGWDRDSLRIHKGR
jgi:hypothetical protein